MKIEIGTEAGWKGLRARSVTMNRPRSGMATILSFMTDRKSASLTEDTQNIRIAREALCKSFIWKWVI